MYFFPPWYELINKTHGITHTINHFSNLHCNLWGCSPGFHGDRCENKCRYPTLVFVVKENVIADNSCAIS